MENANTSHKKLELFIRDYSYFNQRNILNDLTRLDSTYFNNDSDINYIYDKSLEDITTLAEKHVSIIKCTKKESKPWNNNRIPKKMKVRDQLLRKMKRDRNETNTQIYKKLRLM